MPSIPTPTASGSYQLDPTGQYRMYDTMGLTNNSGQPLVMTGAGPFGQGMPGRASAQPQDDAGVSELIAYLQRMLGTSGFWGDDAQPSRQFQSPQPYSGQWGRMPR
jgi:hypothetical protein